MDNWEVKRVDNSRPPLRWIANLFGEISGWAILRCSYHEEYANDKKAKFYAVIFDRTYPFYQRYGTFYKLDIPIEEDYA
jgi:hypothetical protein